jgi:hypothetical protein
VAIKDTQDAIDDLNVPTLSGQATAQARVALSTVKLTLQNSAPYAANEPAAPMIQALTWLDIAEKALLPGNPGNDF